MAGSQAVKRAPQKLAAQFPQEGELVSQIKAALTAAKSLTAQNASERAALRQAGLAQRSPIIQANQRAAERLLASLVEKSGFDSGKFEEIQAQNRTEVLRILEAQRAEAAKDATEAIASFRSAVSSRRKIIEGLAASTGTQVVLDSPFLIWPQPPTTDLFFDDYRIEPWNSWAKFKIDSTNSATDTVNFYFLWQNSSDQYVVINVDSWLMLAGACRVDIPGHWYEYEYSSINNIYAQLSLLEWWNQPPTTPAAQADQIQEVLSFPLFIEKGVLGSFLSPQSEGVFRTRDLRYNVELVPPQGVVVIEVGASIRFQNDNGGVEADFDSGSFQVMCPFVQIQIML